MLNVVDSSSSINEISVMTLNTIVREKVEEIDQSANIKKVKTWITI